MTGQLRLGGAIAIGLASMLGAGVFVVFREGYAISPAGFFLSITLGALVAALNARSVYQLAKHIDRPGGVYAYSRVLLSERTSFIAGVAFVLGKIASIAAIGLVFAEYVAEGNRLVAVSVILLLAAVNLAGINRTASVAAVISAVTLAFLGATFSFGFTVSSYADTPHREYLLAGNFDAWHILQAAAIFFFAFAGYARVATLGNEVREAKRNIPRAIIISLSIVTALYFAIGWQLERVFGQDLHVLTLPIQKLAKLAMPALPEWAGLLAVSLATLGSLLALLAGVSRTFATMAEDREAPAFLSKRNRFKAPLWAELAIAFSACGLVFLPSLSWVVGFSSFNVLLYYAIGHLCALKQNGKAKPVAAIGLALNIALALCVPGPAVLFGSALLLTALALRRLLRA